jgi:dipeptidyl aminopeptidase/acylaminoacyl peptidase
MSKFFSNKRITSAAFLILIILISTFLYSLLNRGKNLVLKPQQKQQTQNLNPLSIAAMRAKDYPGSAITIEQNLLDRGTYHQYIVSYKSEGLKIYALLTVPIGQKPKNGWPTIIFNHGYIPPQEYRTTERYIAYVEAFARSGYIVLKPDYRGNGSSEGSPEGAYYSPAYATDVLNALSSMKKYKDTNPNKIGMWGHSMGGNITLRDLVVNTKDIKAAVIWGGVVGSYNDLLNNWQRRVTYQPPQNEMALRINGRQALTSKYGTPLQNPDFWNSLDPTHFISDITAPIQLDVGGADEEVPPAFSQNLYNNLKKAGKNVEIYIYPGSDHNISQSLNLALQRSVDFFNKYLKGGE